MPGPGAPGTARGGAERVRSVPRVAVVAMLAVLAIATVAPPAVAGPPSDAARAAAPQTGARLEDPVRDRADALAAQIAQLRGTLEGASAELVEAVVGLRRAQAQLAQARAALEAARARLRAATARDAVLAARLAYARAQEEKATQELRAGRAAQRRTEAALGRIAREAYVGSGLAGLSLALQAETPEDFAVRLTVAGAAIQSQGSAVRRLAVEQADMRARTDRVQALRDQVAELKRQSAALVVERRDAEAASRAAETRIAGLVATERATVADITARVAAEKARLDRLRAEQTRLRAVLAARARAAAERARAAARSRGSRGGIAPRTSSGGFLSYPTSAPVTSSYGMRFHPVLRYWRLHSGTDFGSPCGSPIRAAAPGQVVSVGWAGGYGNRVVLDHGFVRGVGLATTYNHLTRAVVGGGSVGRGQLIGYSGTTGLSTGCHLHFETLVNGGYVNPMGWL